MIKKAKEYIANNLFESFRTGPLGKPLLAYIFIPIYICAAAFIGIFSGMFRFGILSSPLVFGLPITLFIFPSFLEEVFFRGLLIPNDTKDKGARRIVFFTLLSTGAFVLWHPLNALIINPEAVYFFLDPYFLIMAGLLGITCSISYIFSGSIWLPILIHWFTVMIWVLFLGGRNKILEI